MTKMRKKKGSKGGRPRKAGDRFACGKLKSQDVAPNQRVEAERRALIGTAKIDIAAASDPLDFALAAGFLSMGRYRAAMAFAKAHGQAQLGAPGLDSGGPQETPTTVEAYTERHHPKPRNPWDVMDDADVVRVFDAVFNVFGPRQDENAALAMRRYKAMMATLSREEGSEVVSVCIRRSWPQWIIIKASGKEVPEYWDRKRRLLEGGLDKVVEAARELAREDKAVRFPPAEIRSEPQAQEAPRLDRGATIIERLNFVDEEGEPIQPLSQYGRPFEVERKVRARG